MTRKKPVEILPAPEGSGFRTTCSIASVLDLLGDKWSLLVVRDLFRGSRRFKDLAASPEGIATNILTERLKRLEAQGIVERVRYQERPPRDEYRLTAKGRELEPVLLACVRWGRKHLPHTRVPASTDVDREST